MKQRLFTILILLAFVGYDTVNAQWMPAPGEAQSKPVYIVGGTMHIGNGQIIENGAIGFEKGKITMVTDKDIDKIPKDNAQVINAEGKHIYPGFISPNSLMGLVEISAVRPTRDFDEVGDYNPHLRSIIAYNTDSWVTPTIRSNGVLLAQIRPQGGRISGGSAIVQLDAWNYEDALVKEDGIILNFPSLVNRKGWWGEPGGLEANKQNQEQLAELKSFFLEAQAYCKQDNPSETDLRFEAMRSVFNKEKKVYISANHAQNIIEVVDFIKTFKIDGVLVGGRDAYLVADVLAESKIPVILNKTHRLPYRADEDIDLPYKLPLLLKEAGVEFCIQAERSSGEQRNLPFTAGKAVPYGLSKEDALQSITLSAAKIMGIDAQFGSLEAGKSATLFISTGDALDPISNHVEVAFIDGREVNLENKQKELYRKFMDKYRLEQKQH